jgi:DNA polymerase III subunit delta'
VSALEPPLQHDSLPGIGAPVLTQRLYGHDAQLGFLSESYRSGRLHHALLFEGPNGVGKATAGFHLAQHLLAFPVALEAPEPLQLLDQTGADFRQLANGTHLQVLHLTRPFDAKTEKFKTVLTVDEVRRIGHFLSRTNTGAGYRVVIIDPADDMNAAAANALLKNLEEPPARTVFVLIAHGAGRLLPTIRSRCQTLRFSSLRRNDLSAAIAAAAHGTDPADDDVVNLAEGSVRRALTLNALGGLEVFRTADQLIETRNFDAEKAGKLGDALGGRDADIQYQLLTDHLLSRIGMAAARHASSANTASAQQLSEFSRETASKLADAQRFNLDRKQTIFGLIASMQGKFSAGLL